MLVAVVSLSGCYTIRSLSDETGPKIYGGVRTRLKDFAEADATREKLGRKVVIFGLDFPFCLIADTLLLPATVFMEPETPKPVDTNRHDENDA